MKVVPLDGSSWKRWVLQRSDIRRKLTNVESVYWLVSHNRIRGDYMGQGRGPVGNCVDLCVLVPNERENAVEFVRVRKHLEVFVAVRTGHTNGLNPKRL